MIAGPRIAAAGILTLGCLLLGAACNSDVGSTAEVAIPDAVAEPTPVLAVRPSPVATSTPLPILPTPTPTPTTAAGAVAPTLLAAASPEALDPDPNGVLPAEVAREIPVDYQLLEYSVGDLNLDGRADLAIIVHQPGDADFGPLPDQLPPRPVLLFLLEKTGTYRLAARSDYAALCGRCGGTFGDPFNDLTIGPGTISIGHYGGSSHRWTETPMFSYDLVADDWVLTGVSRSNFHALDPDNTFEDRSITDVDPIPFADYVAPGMG